MSHVNQYLGIFIVTCWLQARPLCLETWTSMGFHVTLNQTSSARSTVFPHSRQISKQLCVMQTRFFVQTEKRLVFLTRRVPTDMEGLVSNWSWECASEVSNERVLQ